MYLLSALILGLSGNIHCLGMCGPIALSIPIRDVNRFLGAIIYNLGRILTYTLFGAVFGLFGEGLQLFIYQQHISIVIGSLILLSLVFPVLFKGKLAHYLGLNKQFLVLKSRFKKYWNRSSYSSLLVLGVLNGFLPCGLTYIALAGCLALGNIQESMLFMAIFGLGTLPVMLALPLISLRIKQGLMFRFRKLAPIFVLCFGLFLILRGAGLGIPFVSPKLNNHSQIEVRCH